jgi:hypothetical protein
MDVCVCETDKHVLQVVVLGCEMINKKLVGSTLLSEQKGQYCGSSILLTTQT